MEGSPVLQKVVVKLSLGIFSFGSCCVDKLTEQFYKALSKSIALGVFWCDGMVVKTHPFSISGHFIAEIGRAIICSELFWYAMCHNNPV